MKIIDSHVHFLDPERFFYEGLDSVPVLLRPFLPIDFRRAISGIEVSKIVFVEACARPDQSLQEVAWIESLVECDSRIAAIAARVSLGRAEARSSFLKERLDHPMIRAVRDIIQWQPRGYCSSREYIAGAKEMAAHGLPVEVCCFHAQLPDVLELVGQCPKTQFVLNHCGKPGIKEGSFEAWASRIKALSAYENLHCKISGLLTECDWTAWTPGEIIPYIEHVVKSFDSDRILYGGDWPVCTLAGSYQQWFSLLRNVTDSWTEPEQHKFYVANARRLYRI